MGDGVERSPAPSAATAAPRRAAPALRAALGSALGPPFLLFLALPLLVYALNLGAVEIPKRDLLASGIAVTALAAAALFLLARLPRLGAGVVAACDVVSFALFVLLLVPNRSGELTGFGDELAELGDRGPLLKLGALLLVGGLARRLRPRPFRALVQSAVATAALGAAVVALGAVSEADRARRAGAAEARRLVALGEGANVVVLVLDSFTGYRMVEIVEARPEIRAALAGFTLYPRAIASALNTPAGSSALLTGSLELAIEVEKETTRNTLSLDRSFLADAQRAGIEAAYVSPLRVRGASVPASDETPFLGGEAPFPERLRGYLQYVAISSARVLPRRGVEALARSAAWEPWPRRARPESDAETVARVSDHNQRARFAHRQAFENLLATLDVGTARRKALFVFNKFSHEPWNWTEEGRFQPGAGWRSSSIFAARGIVRWVEKLRALGVWDDALVVVASDHGAVPVEDESMGGLWAPEDRPALGFNPLVMVKPPGADQPLRISAMTVWLGDVAATARDALGLPQPEGAPYATRSLLGPDDPARTVAIPVFFRPDQVSYHAPLEAWRRIEFRGTFAELGRAVSTDPERLLAARTRIALGAGKDAYATAVARLRFRDERRRVSSAWIEIGGRQVAEVEGEGVIVVADVEGRFEVRRFDAAAVGMAEWLDRRPTANLFVAAVGISRPLAERRFEAALANEESAEQVNCVVVESARARPASVRRCSSGDVEVEVEWR